MIEPTLLPNGAPRLRDHPVTRGIGNNQILHLADAVDHLLNEAHPAIQGHRQITLFRQAPVTLILFAFDAGGELPDHVAQGIVSIQALDGRLTIHIAGIDHPLDAGQILLLNPAVAHSVRAEIASTMLLTIHHMEPISMAQTTEAQ
ncbi:cupin domain-containing protein [Herpetosiphon gulosus]|uniref:AraC-type arabinose-binding/dimerisation domain-containing protein n=1 Tax=Herpetosiphon gulosus TaxID=1973496 RepID=A0ABP9X1B4_9CHLR